MDIVCTLNTSNILCKEKKEKNTHSAPPEIQPFKVGQNLESRNVFDKVIVQKQSSQAPYSKIDPFNSQLHTMSSQNSNVQMVQCD